MLGKQAAEIRRLRATLALARDALPVARLMAKRALAAAGSTAESNDAEEVIDTLDRLRAALDGDASAGETGGRE